MFPERQLMRWLTITSFVAVCLAYAVIGLGVFTRLSDAGLGCPDWPACYGHFVVPTDAKSLRQIDAHYQHAPMSVAKAKIEMGHRYIAGALGVLMIMTALLCALVARYRGIRFLVFALGLFTFFMYQALLGMWTVTLKLWPVIVTQHLLMGMLIVCLLWLVYLSSRQHSNWFRQRRPMKKIRFFSLFCGVLLLVQIFLGGWTSSNYAGLICHGFPACHATQALSYDFKNAFRFMLSANKNYDSGVLSDAARMTIQMTHRFGAAIVGFSLFILIAWVHVRFSDNRQLINTSRFLFFLFCLQIVLGILNVILQLPIAIAIAHNLMAATILLTVVTLNYYLFLDR